MPIGCRFAARCPLAREKCREEAPAYTEVEPGRMVACHFWQKVKETPAEAGAKVTA
jgi:ABC-type antimicrobial peptide transport system ATPase subunit